ncbi:amino acid adenylation domain protein [Oscillatoria nigro-viridis PCC 7112]|uniref:Amino acid adenylation domain protein n=1 Tax=Phormidium nigroviride PCC 7112 TaxID=179408 RepID=K9VJ11_9CYAN|nr:non-ribosomal peptide synthetase [Oscillatoria nigro-viridis]AFZ07951.1 amino acid adenylation domain protein [Oscillatoria nigro-viridis PCC 7112]
MKTTADLQPKLTAVDFDPFVGGELFACVPATESQKEIWIAVQMGDEANCAYNESMCLRLQGNLDVESLRFSIQELVQRHEALRTTFSPDGSTLCIASSIELDIPVLDLSIVDDRDRESKLAHLRRQEVDRPFNLVRGPLFRSQIIKLQAQEHIVILTGHHIICDGWSWGILLPDLGAIYSARQQGLAANLPQPESFIEYAILQEENSTTAEILEVQKYWLEQFSGTIPVLDLPTDRARPALRTYQGSREDWELNRDLVVNLKRLGKKAGCSFFTTLFAAFEAFMYRLCGQEDLVVGMPAAGQLVGGKDKLAGHCVSLLPIRTRIKEEQSFRDYLRSRRTAILDALDCQQITFGTLVKKLAVPRDFSRIPLVPVTFNLDVQLAEEQLNFDGFKAEVFSNPRTCENFEWAVNASETKNKLVLECQYNTNLFDAATIRRRMAEFEVLLEGIVANPQCPLKNLPILTAAEQQQLLVEWNNTHTNYPESACIHQLFEVQAQQTPDAVALVFGEQQLTYQQLNCRANQLAHYLQTLGAGPEVLAGICLDRSIDAIVSLLAVLKAGSAYLPLDPAYPKDRLDFMVSDAQISLLLTQQNLVERLPDSGAKVICLDAAREEIDAQSEINPANLANADNLAYVMYTSGSTGKPKGVCVVHRGVVRLVKDTNFASLTAAEVFLQLAPISFDASTLEIWGALLNGAQLVVFPPGSPSLAELGEAIRLYNVTILWLTAGLFHLMVDDRIDDLKGVRQLLAGGDVLSVPHVQKLLREVPNCKLINGYGPTENTTFTCCAPIAPDSQITNSVPIGRPIANTQVYILDRHLQPVPIGVAGELYAGGAGLARGYLNRPDLTAERFIPNPFNDFRLPILDFRLGNAGEKLEIAQNQEASDRTKSNRLYKTGDLARYLSDGNIEYLGRADNQVKIRGFRIELGEIETLLTQHPDVLSTAVIDREDTPGNKRLVAYLVSKLIPERIPYHSECQLELDGKPIKLDTEDISTSGVALVGVPVLDRGRSVRLHLQLPGENEPRWLSGIVAWSRPPQTGIQFQLTPNEQNTVNQSVAYQLETQGLWKTLQRTLTGNLRDYLKQRLPDYMIPSAFVLVKELPLNPNGKVDRRALATQKWQSSDAAPNETIAVAARDQLDIQLTEIWQQVLGINSMGIRDNFFEVGGHSLLAARLLAEIEKVFDKKLPLSAIFQSPTVEQLADILREPEWSSPSPSMVVIQPGTGSYKPPLFCIHVLGRGLEFYRPLMNYIDRSQPVLGLSTQIMDEKLAPPNRVEELAAYYIKEMQNFQPHGPYFLLGVSFGGTVAFEMARQLHDLGEKVALLGLLDTYGPAAFKNSSEMKQSEGIMRILRLTPGAFMNKAKSNLIGKIEDLTEIQWRILCNLYRAVGRPLPIYLENFTHRELNHQALKNYVGGVYPGRASIFKAVESAEASGADRELGWGGVITGGIEVHEIPSNHLGMLKEPHVRILGEKLQAAVDRFQRKNL